MRAVGKNYNPVDLAGPTITPYNLEAFSVQRMGPVGDGAHAHHEHLHIGKTLERAALLAMLLMADELGSKPAVANRKTQ